MRFARPALLFALLIAAVPARGQEPFALKDGDRVVFYGDSITEQRLYSTYTETFAVTRFPKRTMTFVHSGWGGDRVTGGGGGPIDVRLSRDVLAYRPTVVTIMLGMNDASYQAFNPRIFETYSKGYRHIVDVLRRDLPQARLTLIVPSPFDDVTQPPRFEGGYNAVLIRYGDFVRELAKENGANVADLNTSVVEATKKAFASDPNLARQLNPDRVHPSPSGQLLMAAALLKSWNAPALVSSITFDGGPDSIPKVANAKIQNFDKTDSGYSWTQLDEALPFPINLDDAATRLAVASSTIVDDLDRQTIRFAGLPKSEYALMIDGKTIGTFSNDQLAKGINIATMKTPMVEQARQVHSLTLKHNNVHYARWRNVELPFSGESAPDLANALKALDALEASIVAKQRETAQPKPHKFELVESAVAKDRESKQPSVK